MLLRELVAKRDRIVSVGSAATVRAAAMAMATANVGCTAILEENRLVGILTERDLVQRVLVKELNIDQTHVSEIMTRKVVVGKADDQIGKAAQLMRKHHIRHLPVIDKRGALLGVLSIRDLLREEIQDMRDYIGQTEG
ncbi:MAG: CBS domain-containing protein [Gemmatimonadota bacterium]